MGGMGAFGWKDGAEKDHKLQGIEVVRSAAATFFNDHAPPHFHARYGEFEATISIDTLAVLEGELPRRALSLVEEWGKIHRAELSENWRLCSEKALPEKIEPLV
jgi:hypothetical protein